MRRLLMLCVLALTFAAPAPATIREDPVDVRPVLPAQALASGHTAVLAFQIQATVPVTITNPRLRGRGWRTAAADPRTSLRLDARTPVTLRFHATPDDPGEPLILTMEVGGRPWQRAFDLSRRGPGSLRPVEAPVAPPIRGPDLRPQPAAETDDVLGGATIDRVVSDAGEPPRADARDIRVHGRLVYLRSDGIVIGADAAEVTVNDEDTGLDEQLAIGLTDPAGYYDFTFHWAPCLACDQEPDLYVRFEATNGVVDVEDTDHLNYAWLSATVPNYGGTSLDMGTLSPTRETDHPALHILTDIVRDWRWYVNVQGYDPPKVDAMWPDGVGAAWYTPSSAEIHLGSNHSWYEPTHAHEYGHHWMHTYAVSPSPDYCNGSCDDPGDCGHCMWCEERGSIAWTEGWPNWMAQVQPRSYLEHYGLGAQYTESAETILTCGPVVDDPLLTEGIVTALLQDIWDTNNEDDPNIDGDWRDRLSLGTLEIFEVVDLDHPLDPADFLRKFKARFPATTEELWETGRNCGYDLDTDPPGVVTDLLSTSHATGVPSPDATIDFRWTRATDDWSGVANHAVLVAPNPTLPGFSLDLGDTTQFTTGPLAPGTYYFCVRTFDRANRWSSTYAWTGPYVIRPAEPANLAPVAAPGWDRPSLPRGAPDATSTSVPFPPTLPGNVNSTYWNARGMNIGEAMTSTGFWVSCLVDGVPEWGVNWGPVGGGQEFLTVNRGPFTVRGGRHVLASRVDSYEEISEASETDNVYGRQFVWIPHVLTPGVPEPRTAPPSAIAGWGDITEGAYLFNSDGLRIVGSGWWNAVTVRAVEAGDDFDCRLHFATASADTGFAMPRGISARGAGYLDAVLVNRNVLGQQTWDVGVINYANATGNYVIEHSVSSQVAFGDSLLVTLGADQYIALREFLAGSGQTGPVSITARVVSGHGPVYLSWLDPTFTTGGLSDCDAWSVSPDAWTTARLDLWIGETGWNGIVLHRDPRDGPDPVTVVLEVETTPADLEPVLVAGWHAPLVPRAAPDGTPASVALPDTLYGDRTGTYLNFAFANAGPSDAAMVNADVCLDGESAWSWFNPTFPAQSQLLSNQTQPVTVPAGRHTLALVLDPTGQVDEIDEQDNVYGEQYVWAPRPLVPNEPVWRNAPPDRLGGWGEVRSGEPFWYNVDGVRMRGDLVWWAAVSVVPGAASDVDLRLHDRTTGTKFGFEASLAVSGWGVGQTDYVLTNFTRALPVPVDVGLMRWSGSEACVVEAVRATSCGNAAGSFGPYTLGPDHALALYDFWFEAGTYHVTLTNVDGAVDWGVSLHPGDRAYQGKSDALATEWLAGPGGGESLIVEVPSAWWYCLAVWKRGADDLPLSGTFGLEIHAGSTAVGPGAPPARTAFAAVHPNPFAPSTSLRFDLARADDVGLVIHDLRGARVRTLIRGRWPAGRHELIWDGRDDRGRPVPAGVYVVSFSSGAVSSNRKVVRLR